jgi:AAA+ superfamily predicted ATPase
LKQGNPYTPMNVILAGSASTGKTDLALLAADQAQAPAYSVVSPKAPFVGETERLVKLQWRALRELSPAIAFVDEITEVMPMRRGEMNLDSGASAAVTAELLTALSDRGREGKNLLIATTNRPFAIDPALATRFVFIPVLSPLREDYPAIIVSLLKSLLRERTNFATGQNEVIEAANVFYEKGLTPRVVRAVFLGALSETGGQLDASQLVSIANDACEAEPKDRIAGEYADLWALRYTFLPWSGVSAFPIPKYLSGIVRSNGSLDRAALDARITELSQHAKY